jgi:hypothetical protein
MVNLIKKLSMLMDKRKDSPTDIEKILIHSNRIFWSEEDFKHEEANLNFIERPTYILWDEFTKKIDGLVYHEISFVVWTQKYIYVHEYVCDQNYLPLVAIPRNPSLEFESITI